MGASVFGILKQWAFFRFIFDVFFHFRIFLGFLLSLGISILSDFVGFFSDFLKNTNFDIQHYLDNIIVGNSDGSVVSDGCGLHGLDQSALDVSGFGGFDSGIDETLSASHGVEEKLGGRQAGQVRVLHEPLRLRRVIVLHEMRQSSIIRV